MSLKNAKGFTIVELLVALGVASVAMGLVASTQISIIKDQIRMRKMLDANIDETLAERILFNDFNGLDPSYNNLTMLDDNGQSFFDFYPDIPSNSLQGATTRQVTLSLKAKTEFYILTQDRSAGNLLIYDPVMAYNVGEAPTDFNQAAALNFVSVNRNNWVSAQRPGFWITNRLLMLDTPARVRIVTNGKTNLQIPPRSPIFVGTVSGANLLPLTGTIANSINNKIPDTGAVIDSADTLLRNVPSVGGGQSIVRLRAVKIIKYYLEKSIQTDGYKNPPANLYRTIYENGKFSTPVLLADHVDSFTLRRDSVLKRMIYFKVNKSESL